VLRDMVVALRDENKRLANRIDALEHGEQKNKPADTL
jgi:BMFP domain-containing protein YqiC